MNLDKAVQIVAELDRLRAVQRELKAAFKNDELDGGWKAALDHPLYQQASERIAALQEDLKILI